jgi:hypothetical protein
MEFDFSNVSPHKFFLFFRRMCRMMLHKNLIFFSSESYFRADMVQKLMEWMTDHSGSSPSLSGVQQTLALDSALDDACMRAIAVLLKDLG